MMAVVAKTRITPERELWKCRGCGKRGKPEAGFPLFPQPLGNLAKDRRDSHISTAPTGSRRMEKWKTKSRFPTFPPPRIHISRNENQGRRAGFALRPAAGASRRLKSQRVIVVDPEK
jgi:hypothetical protein